MPPSLLSKNFCLYIFPSIPIPPAYSRKTHIIEDAPHCRLLKRACSSANQTFHSNPILAEINFQRLVYSKPFVEGFISRITVSLGTIIIFSVWSQHPSAGLQLLQQLHLHLSHSLPWSSFLQFGLKCPSRNLFLQRQWNLHLYLAGFPLDNFYLPTLTSLCSLYSRPTILTALLMFSLP